MARSLDTRLSHDQFPGALGCGLQSLWGVSRLLSSHLLMALSAGSCSLYQRLKLHACTGLRFSVQKLGRAFVLPKNKNASLRTPCPLKLPEIRCSPSRQADVTRTRPIMVCVPSPLSSRNDVNGRKQRLGGGANPLPILPEAWRFCFYCA